MSFPSSLGSDYACPRILRGTREERKRPFRGARGSRDGCRVDGVRRHEQLVTPDDIACNLCAHALDPEPVRQLRKIFRVHLLRMLDRLAR